jgi:type IV secretion system protein VirB10
VTTDSPASAYPDADVRPIVRTAAPGNRSLWIFAAVLLVGGVLLFEGLNARREQLSAPATQAIPANGAMVTAPPPLDLPPQFRDYRYVEPNIPQPALLPARPIAPPLPPQVITRVVERPAPAPSTPQRVAQPFLSQPTVIQAPPLSSSVAGGEKATPVVVNDRVLAGHLRNPSFTVPQGTVIAAVLETALDSTRPGGARAIVQRDVMGFDGTRVLIPRGSRLYGEYASDLGAGQKRALIRWTRLTRPDAVIVNLDSPSADPLGRAGVGGKVNNHFFERFGGAILQSVLDIGAGFANSAAFNNGVYVAFPGAAQGVPNVQPQQIKPTLKVKQGTSVSVFVARDLDFSTVDQ